MESSLMALGERRLKSETKLQFGKGIVVFAKRISPFNRGRLSRKFRLNLLP
jgi:hypothetical protein